MKGVIGIENEELKLIYVKYSNKIYLYLFSLCHNHSLAEDLMQETDITLDKDKVVEINADWLENNLYSNSFTRGLISEKPSKESNDMIIKELKNLPNSASVEACLSFKEDINLNAIKDFRDKYELNITYVPIKTSEEYSNYYYGFEPNGTGIVFEEDTYDNKKYPYLELANVYNESSNIDEVEAWITHFKSMLKYMNDNKSFNEAIDNYAEYDLVLNYVEENGVKSFGVVAMTSPETLLKIMNEGFVEKISILDVKVSMFSK